MSNRVPIEYEIILKQKNNQTTYQIKCIHSESSRSCCFSARWVNCVFVTWGMGICIQKKKKGKKINKSRTIGSMFFRSYAAGMPPLDNNLIINNSEFVCLCIVQLNVCNDIAHAKSEHAVTHQQVFSF